MSATRFDRQQIFIVGGSSGIGLAIAKRYAAHGAHVAIFARRAEVLEQAAADIEAVRLLADQRVSHWSVDVADHAQVTRVMSEAVAACGPPTSLINCAGRAHPKRFEDISPAELADTLRVNLGGCWNVIQAVLPAMKARGSGYVVNVSSLAGLIGVFGYTDYCASKFALVGFSEALRSELKPYGITVSVLCPPDTQTPGLTSENEHKPAETSAISANTSVISADVVAESLFRGMGRKQFLIVPGLESKIAALARRLTPALVFWVIDRTVQRTRHV